MSSIVFWVREKSKVVFKFKVHVFYCFQRQFLRNHILRTTRMKQNSSVWSVGEGRHAKNIFFHSTSPFQFCPHFSFNILLGKLINYLIATMESFLPAPPRIPPNVSPPPTRLHPCTFYTILKWVMNSKFILSIFFLISFFWLRWVWWGCFCLHHFFEYLKRFF